MVLTGGDGTGAVGKRAKHSFFVAATGLLIAACGSVGEQPVGDAGLGETETDAARADSGIVLRDAAPFDAGDRDASMTCEKVTVQSEPATIPEVMIVLDKSNSMNARPDGSSETLWDGARLAIESLTERVGDSVAFGLGTFPHFESGMALTQENACTTGGVRTELALESATAIRQELIDASVRGNTPTAATLVEVRDHLSNTPQQDPDADRIVVLVTDGAPNCGTPEGTTCVCTRPSTAGCLALHCLDDVAAVDAVSGLAEDGVRVYVIGFAVSGWGEVLDEMAAAGATDSPAHIPANDTSELVQALDEVTYGALPCEYDLESEPADPRFVRVVLDGEQVNPESANPERGWRMQGRELQLVGEACETLRNGASQHTLEITIECEPVPLI